MKDEKTKRVAEDFISGILLGYLLLGIYLLLTGCDNPTGTEQAIINQDTKIDQVPIECSRYTLIWEQTSEQVEIYIGSFAKPTGQALNDIFDGGYDYLLIAGKDLRHEEHIGLVEWQQCPQYREYIGVE